VASGIDTGTDLVVTGGMVYFPSKLGLQKVSTSGGTVSTVKGPPLGGQVWQYIAADSSSVYMGGSGVDLVRVDLNAGGTTRLATGAASIALDDINVFWATRTDISSTLKVP
jgi:hypothetical protein